MATVPVTRVWVAGEVVTSAYMNNNVTGPTAWLLAPAICQLRQIVAQSIANNSYTAVTFTAEDVDTTGMHSTVSNTSRMTAVYPGWYHHDGGSSIVAGATGVRGCRWAVNGTAVNASGLLFPANAAATISAARSMLIFLNVGDYSELQQYQNQGSAQNTVATAESQASATAWWASN